MKNFKPPDSSPGKFQTLGSGGWGEGVGTANYCVCFVLVSLLYCYYTWLTYPRIYSSQQKLASSRNTGKKELKATVSQEKYVVL